MGVAWHAVTYALTEGATAMSERKRKKYFRRDLVVGMMLNVFIILPLFCVLAARYPL